MTLNNADLDYLIELENKLSAAESWACDANKLKKLNEKLIKQRDKKREDIRKYVNKKRKVDKTYGRSKAEKERIKRNEFNHIFN